MLLGNHLFPHNVAILIDLIDLINGLEIVSSLSKLLAIGHADKRKAYLCQNAKDMPQNVTVLMYCRKTLPYTQIVHSQALYLKVKRLRLLHVFDQRQACL